MPILDSKCVPLISTNQFFEYVHELTNYGRRVMKEFY